MKSIDSIKNQLVRKTAGYSNLAKAREAGVFVVEGMRAFSEIPRDWEMESIWVTRHYVDEHGDPEGAVVRNTPVYLASDEVFKKISQTVNPQGILAVVRRKYGSLEVMARPEGLWIILENLQDPGNVGTIIRTADAAGVTGIICTKGTADFYNSKVVRAAMGSLFHIPFCTVASIREAADFIKAQQGSLIGTHLRGEKSHFEAPLKGAAGIIIGNEGSGMTDEAAALCTDLVKIPMPGQAESLNAGIAAAVMMYEAVRQRLS